MKGCANGVPQLNLGDAAEVEKFRAFLRLTDAGKSEREAYAEIYGEVVFDAAAPPTTEEPK